MLQLNEPELRPGHQQRLQAARRTDPQTLLREVRRVSESPIVTALLDSVDTLLLVLNAERQIVASNGRGLSEASAAIVGARPGEALGCANARAPGVCGTAAACGTCCALAAILACGTRKRATEAECLISSPERGRPLQLSVRATPISIEGETFTVVSLRDVSAEKHREALEQIFLHDVLNTVTALRGWATRLRRPGADAARAGERVDLLSRHIEREIRDHRTLMLLENGELVPRPSAVRVGDLLRDLELVFSSHLTSDSRRLIVETPVAEPGLETDPSLLLRVLVNMTRNALEATPEGGAVRVWIEQCSRLATRSEETDVEVVRFNVHNEGVILPEIQARIFQRSFSTKAQRGRGFGTYSMKLIGERYLSGVVSFVSAPATGTVFSIELPASAGSGSERSP